MKALPIPQITPMMRQYLEIKSDHQDYLLFYRMGDFYELFFEDAITAASVLDIVLTKRGKHMEDSIPMCGVPAHSSEYYLAKLIKAGHKVAICEQMEKPEDAKKRGYKAVVKREVIRIVTQGTISDEKLLDPKAGNYIASIAEIGNKYAIAWAEITTGEFYFAQVASEAMESELNRIMPSEIVIADGLYENPVIFNQMTDFKQCITTRAQIVFDRDRALRRALEFFSIESLDGIGEFDAHEISAIGALIEYISHTHKSHLPRLDFPRRFEIANFMQLDPATRRNLELSRSISDKGATLLSTLDKTVTSSGTRLLAQYISSPLADIAMINKRLDAVEFFKTQEQALSWLREQLKKCPDIERALTKIFTKAASPFDLSLIKRGLTQALTIANGLLFSNINLPELLSFYLKQIGGFSNALENLNSAIVDDATNKISDGQFIKPGYSLQLDELYEFSANTDLALEKLRDKYRSETGVSTLKISFNNVIGYFVDVTPSHVAKIISEIFIHKQTLGNSVRYKTEELAALESKILNCNAEIGSLEAMIFSSLCDEVMLIADGISKTAKALAVLDLLSTLAEAAVINGYVRPMITADDVIDIHEGRHPVVEKSSKVDFVPNDLVIDEKRLWLITGPNMAGKSTFLRQNAIIVIMAQMGSFVPATNAKIGVVDKLFCRIGSGDDIAKGRSTFMVEMTETAYILNNATNRSFVILDEVGRGTSTYDGLSIAWAVVENLHNVIGAKTLFATHYHELTELEQKLARLECHTVDVKEWGGKVLFLHKVKKGKADKSYGVHVAALAGIPQTVTLRASEILSSFDEKK